MHSVIVRGLFMLGFVLPMGVLYNAPPGMAKISDIVPSTPKEIDKYCRSLPGNGCANGQLADPLCEGFCQELPDLDHEEPREPGLPPEQLCADGIDNNGDGLIDCADPDCASNPVCQELCDDGIDNDGDLKVDCADSDCALELACDEVCDDGIDNDGDLKVDCADSDCALDSTCPENCSDGIDDDGDGDVDCEDLECLDTNACRLPRF